MSSETVEIDAGDVIRLMLQFCKENGLTRTLRVMQEESQVPLNIVDNLGSLINHVNTGNWDQVIQAISSLKLPTTLLEDIFEQIVLELLEAGEVDTAKMIIRSGQSGGGYNGEDNTSAFSSVGPMTSMRSQRPEKYLRLQRLSQKQNFDTFDGYEGVNRDKRRALIANALQEQIVVVPPGRLMTVLSQSLKYQQSQGSLPSGGRFDLFRGIKPAKAIENETWPSLLDKTIKNADDIQFGDKSHPEVARFSPDGNYLVTGSVDGFVEVWNWVTGKLVKDVLKYQAQDQFMMHDDAILCLAFTSDSVNLASGSQDGKIKVWQISTGKCLVKFEQAHSQGVTCVQFAKDNTQLLSGSFDATIRIHGLKSGKTLKIFRGHSSFVNDCIFSLDNTKIYSASSDSTVKVWDTKTTECIDTFSPAIAPILHKDGKVTQQGEKKIKDIAVNTLCLNPKNKDQIVVCNRSPTLYVLNQKGQVVERYETDKMTGERDFITCLYSPKGDYLFAISEDRHLYCFNTLNRYMEHSLKAHEKDVIGFCHHPINSMVATYSDEGLLKIWK
ncbi:WD40 repeat-containing protein SMU1-like [Planoprotostelium fungivorum]|uniref:WD40 repeat-containing protein SMU1 n=1 Tax=Planoprotostelium fungivorum TaxID=1890364 RepID=A0A2P6N7F7_9EUKA|nr:WD40 repeat-containing protein SMU1-like [Planoprotostelium fungivorum]